MSDANPYRPPGSTEQREAPREDRILRATFEVDRKLVRRALGFLAERRLHVANLELVLSCLLLSGLLAGMLFSLPRAWWLGILALFLLQPLLLAWQWRHVRRQLEAWQLEGRWPARLGVYRLEVSLDHALLQVDAAAPHQQHAWALHEISEIYYLGDLLLLIPEPQVLIPIPRTAEFGGETFATFCRTLAIRYRAVAGLPAEEG